MRQELKYVLFLVLIGSAAEAEPVRVLLRGPNPILQQRLDQLSKHKSYDAVVFTNVGETVRRRLTVTRSGGIEAAEVVPILRAIRIQSEWRWFVSPWRVSIHGNSNLARVEVRYCDLTDKWLLIKEESGWEVLDQPNLFPPRCFVLPPSVHESQR
jgi:hypothetical protein